MFCSHCGASNPDNASYCQYCGNTLGGPAGGGPLPSGVPPSAPPSMPPMAAPTGYGAPPPAPRRRRSLARTILIILVVVVVVILVLGVVAYFLIPPAPSVTITVINFQSSDNVCGLNGATSQGYTANTSETDQLSFGITGNNTTGGGTAACTIHTISTSTPGFSISGANVPLAIPANQTENLVFDLTVPSSGYNGNVTLVLT